MSASDAFVQLKGGLITPVAAIKLALNLEARGCQMEREGDDLIVGPRTLITDDDRAAIRMWKTHLLAILAYCDTGVTH